MPLLPGRPPACVSRSWLRDPPRPDSPRAKGSTTMPSRWKWLEVIARAFQISHTTHKHRNNRRRRARPMLEPMEDRMLLSTIYDPAAQFSALSNPTGVWTYGYKSLLGAASPFIVDNYQFRFTTGLDSWGGRVSSDGNPTVTHNSTANPITFSSLTVNPG